jgi:glycine cleavage system aminomethyltransferase T
MEMVQQHKARANERGGLTQKMAQVFVEDPEPLLSHGEVMWKDGERISEIRSASYGHFLKGAVGLSMVQAPKGNVVNKDFLTNGNWEIEIANEKYPCKLSFAPFYDPKGLKVKG